MAQILAGLGYEQPKYHIPFFVVYIVATLLMLVVNVLRPVCKWTPTFTPMSVALAGTHHYYSSQNAKCDLDYKPVIPLQLAIAETVESFGTLKKE